MKRNRLCIILLSIILLLLTASCEQTNSTEHIKKAKEFEKVQDYENAANEYIRALKGIKSTQEMADTYKKIAQLYKKMRRNDESIEYFKKSIESYDYIKQPAPYMELAQMYILSDKIPNAVTMVSDLERTKPLNYKQIKAEIMRAVAVTYDRQKKYEDAKHYYTQLQTLAEEAGNQKMLTNATRRLEGIEKKQELSPLEEKESTSEMEDSAEKK